MLSDRRPAHVPTGVSQELSLRLKVSDVNDPLPSVLRLKNCFDLFVAQEWYQVLKGEEVAEFSDIKLNT